jgi:hypothetical protein
MFGTLITDGIAGCNMDLLTDTGWTGSTAGIRFITTGTPGSRILTVEWLHTRPFFGFVHAGNDEGNFQIKLFEATGEIDVVYGLFIADYYVNYGANCQVGLTGAVLTDFNIRSTLGGVAHLPPDYGSYDPTPWDSTIAATASNNQKSYYKGNLPNQPIGLTYKWIPLAAGPVSNFVASDTAFCAEAGGCINFSDHSSGNPTSWKWLFPGAVPDSSIQQNPSNICYFSAGTYSVTLIVSNANGSDTLAVSPMITVGGTPPAPIITLIGNDTLMCNHASSYQWYFNGAPIISATDSFYIASQSGSYNVYITDSIGCGRLGNSITFISVNEITGQKGIEIYPNPVKGEFTVYSLEFTVKMIINIYDDLGEKIYSGVMNEKRKTINCKSFPSGIYFVRLESEQGRWVGRFVKN